MELSEKAREEILKSVLCTFDTVAKTEDIKDWRSIFEATLQCLLTLGCTEAIQLFATMCLQILDFDTYSELEDVFINRSKIVNAINTQWYNELNESSK